MLEVLTLILALILVIIIIFATYFAARWFQKNFGGLHNGEYIKVIDRNMLGRDQGIALVKINEMVYVVGVTTNQITLLEKIDGSDFSGQYVENEQDENSFSNRFQQLIQQQRKNNQK